MIDNCYTIFGLWKSNKGPLFLMLLLLLLMFIKLSYNGDDNIGIILILTAWKEIFGIIHSNLIVPPKVLFGVFLNPLPIALMRKQDL